MEELIEFLFKVFDLVKSFKASDWIAIVAALIALLSLVVARRTAVNQYESGKDKELLNQLILTLERAYSALSREEGAAPLRDRLAWLTSARHLLAYRELKEKFSTDLYRQLANEHEEFWRHRFYVLLSSIESSQYYWWKARDGSDVYIEPRSAVIINRFAAWPNDRSDSVDSIDFVSEINKLPSSSFSKVRKYVEEKFPNLSQASKAPINR